MSLAAVIGRIKWVYNEIMNDNIKKYLFLAIILASLVFSYAATEGGRGGSAPSIKPGSQETQINVTLTYEIR